MKPVYLHVKTVILKRLQQLPLESRLPSDRELARELNVAILTVSRAMNELAREGFVVRRPRSGTFLASHERMVAAHHDRSHGLAGNVILAYPNFFSHHFFRHARLAEEFALKSRLRLIEYKLTPESTPETLVAFARDCENLRGLMILGSMALTPSRPQTLALIDNLNKPVVFLSQSLSDTGRNLHWRNTDWFATGRLAAEALLQAGHRRIAWVNHDSGHNDDIARGMRQALKDLGRPSSDLVTIGQGIQDWADSRESGYRLTQRLLDEGEVTGAYYDSLAGVRGALLALWERDLRVPRDLSVVVTGNQSGDERYFTPPLTTLDADWEAEMRDAFAIILGAQPARARGQHIPLHLHKRASIATPRSHSGVVEAVLAPAVIARSDPSE